MSYFSNYYSKVNYPIETKQKNGLRNAQIGAVHAIASFFTLHEEKSAIVVMPTGSGKTAVLMIAPYLISEKKVLIVTPSAMVREQIVEDYVNLSTLVSAGVFSNTMRKPTVFDMSHTYSKDMLQEVKKHDVVVATHFSAVSLSVEQEAKDYFDTVIIDEAHHVPAVTWQRILSNMSNCKSVLFTATPFRLDKKDIQGEIIYNYPLARAYKDGIFGEILYVPIAKAENKDELIAKKAEEILNNDRNAGDNHYLMVRTSSRKDAKRLEGLYKNITSLRLKRIDSTIGNKKVKIYIEMLKLKQIDGIICVDMLGEGFNFPNLKVAAIHKPPKSLAATLQFIGRFARTNSDDIGTAKFIAMEDEEIQIENQKLYSSDSVWMDMIIDMSDGKVKAEKSNKEYYSTFKETIQNEEKSTEEISLQMLRPNAHAAVYKIGEFNIDADFPSDLNVIVKKISTDDNTVVAVGRDLTAPKWSTTKNISDRTYSLYILHYQYKNRLLFIYSQVKSPKLYESILSCFSNSNIKVARSEMHKVLGGLDKFEIFNTGLQNRYQEGGEAYRISAGADVGGSIDTNTGKLYAAGHIFCKASTDEGDVTIGYSSSSKMWSSSYFNIPEYVKWCDNNGEKICNPQMVVKTNTSYDLLRVPEMLQFYPETVFYGDFHHESYKSRPMLLSKSNDKEKYILVDLEIVIDKVEQYCLYFSLVSSEQRIHLMSNVKGEYTLLDDGYKLVNGNKNIDIAEYLGEYPISFKSTDDDLIISNEIIKGFPEDIVMDIGMVQDVDWKKYKTDIHKEFEDNIFNSSSNSIHASLYKMFMDDDYDFVVYDHTTGEIADFIVGRCYENIIKIELYHVKKKSSVGYNSSVGDVYEVTGQSIKSVNWLASKQKFLNKVNDRVRAGKFIFRRGSRDEFTSAINTKQLKCSIVMVQPSLTSELDFPVKISEVLAATNYYIKNSGKVNEFKVWGSKIKDD